MDKKTIKQLIKYYDKQSKKFKKKLDNIDEEENKIGFKFSTLDHPSGAFLKT